MGTRRFFEIASAIILAALASCLGCGLAGRLLLGGEADATPVAASPTATHVLTATFTPPSHPTSTPTSTPTSPQPLLTLTPTPTLLPPSPIPTPLSITNPSLTDRALLERQFQEAAIGQQVVLLVHDDHLEREIAAYLATQLEVAYRNVTVRFTPELVELGGEVQVLGIWVPATVRGQVMVRDCLPEATITELEVGGFLTPRWARDYVANLIYDTLDRYPDDLLVCLESISVREGEAVVEGTKR